MNYFYSRFFVFLCCLFSICHGEAREHAPFIVYSPPKCGTHLIANTLAKMVDKEPYYMLTEMVEGEKQFKELLENLQKNNQFLVAHNFSLSQLKQACKMKHKIIFTLRDPRDQLVSLSDWFDEGQWSWVPASKLYNMNERIEEMICGKKFGWIAYECLQSRLSNLKKLHPRNCAVIRFENIVGPLGNGSADLQVEELLKIARLINLPLKEKKALLIADQLFGNTKTFRKGQAGRWRDYFTPEHISLYKKIYGKELIKLGYEKDKEWY